MIDTKELRNMVNGAQFESFANSAINALLDRLEAAEKERDALRAMLMAALDVLEDVKGNINPERGYADELETDVKRAIAALSLYNAKGE